MRNFLFSTTLVAATVGIASLAGLQPAAQAQGVRPGHQIAVVDVSVVFKQHQRFLAQTEKFKKDVEAAEGALKKEFEQIKAMQEQLKAFAPGSPNYKEMEQRIARAGADWQLKQQSQKKELMDYEGRIYFQVYKELDDAVQRFAKSRNIALVLRYASDPVDDPNNRNEIVRGINKSVVYVDPSLDITMLILEDLNRSGPPVTGNVGQGGIGVTPRQGAALRPGVQR